MKDHIQKMYNTNIESTLELLRMKYFKPESLNLRKQRPATQGVSKSDGTS